MSDGSFAWENQSVGAPCHFTDFFQACYCLDRKFVGIESRQGNFSQVGGQCGQQGSSIVYFEYP